MWSGATYFSDCDTGMSSVFPTLYSVVDIWLSHSILPHRGGMTDQVSTDGSRLLVTLNDREGDRLLLAA